MVDMTRHYCILRNSDVNADIDKIDNMIKSEFDAIQSSLQDAGLIKETHAIESIKHMMEHMDSLIDAKYTIANWESHRRFLQIPNNTSVKKETD